MGKKNIIDNSTTVITEKDKELQEHLLFPCANKHHFKQWLKVYLDVDLADFTVSRFATTNPLDAAWEIYSYAIHGISDDPLNILYVASRASQKTLGMAAVELAVMLHDRRDMLHYAAADNQAKVGWGYLKDFAQRPFIRDYLETKPTNNDIVFNLPNYKNPDEPCKLVRGKVLSITLLNAQGQHAPFVSIDELLTLAHDKRKAYYDLSGVPVSTPEGRPYIRAEISSRKGPYSVVEEKIKDRHKTGLVVKSWTVFENQKRCPDERSGTIPTIFYGNHKTTVVLNQEQYEELNGAEKSKFHQAQGFDKCLDCKIASFCMGDAKKQISKCRILNPVEKTLTDFRNTTLDLWLSQRMSIQPSLEGLVFPKWSTEKNVKNLKQIWEIFTGTEINFNPSLQRLITLMHEGGCAFYAGVDHSGGASPYAIVTVGIDKQNRVYLMNVFGKLVEFEEMELELSKLHEVFKFKAIFPDPAAKDKNDRLRKNKKWRIKDKFSKHISLGIDLIRFKLQSASGDVSFFALDTDTAFFQDEISEYHLKELPDGKYADEPEGEKDHSLDALRYVFQNIFTIQDGEWKVSVFSEEVGFDSAKLNNDPNAHLNYWFKQQVQMIVEEKTAEVVNPTGTQDGYTIFSI